MYETPIILSSSQCTSGKSHNFSTKFIPSINLDPNTKYKIALVSLNMSYSWHNIAKQYENTTIKFKYDTNDWAVITFPDGNYSYQNIEDFINLRIKAKLKPDDKEPLERNVKLTFDLTTLKIILYLADKFQLDLREGNFHKLLGFDAKIYTTTAISQNTPDITNSIDSLLINCSILSDSYVFGHLGSSLASVDVSGLPLSYPFKFVPRVLLFHEINTSVINSITISVSDVLYRPINLNDTPVEVTLLLRET